MLAGTVISGGARMGERGALAAGLQHEHVVCHQCPAIAQQLASSVLLPPPVAAAIAIAPSGVATAPACSAS